MEVHFIYEPINYNRQTLQIFTPLSISNDSPICFFADASHDILAVFNEQNVWVKAIHSALCR